MKLIEEVKAQERNDQNYKSFLIKETCMYGKTIVRGDALPI